MVVFNPSILYAEQVDLWEYKASLDYTESPYYLDKQIKQCIMMLLLEEQLFLDCTRPWCITMHDVLCL